MRVLIIGLGSIAKKHIAALRKLEPTVEIIALRSSTQAKPVGGVCDIYSWEEIMGLGKIDFAIISNPTSEHVVTIEKLTAYNIPLFIEKPLNSQVVDDALVHEIEAKGMLTYIACNLRFLECLQEAKKIADSQRINEVNVYCGSYLPDWRPGVDFRTVYSAVLELGGGVHIDLIHEIDYVYWLFGAPRKTHSFFTNHSSLDIRAYDYANYLFEYEAYSANIILNYYRRDYKRTLEMLTDSATYYVDLAKNTITRNGEIVFSSEQTIIDTYESQMAYFIGCVKQENNTFNPIHIANDILKICLQDDSKR